MNSYEELFYRAPVAFHEVDGNGIIQRVNEAECELLGYTEAELIGQPIWRFIAREEVSASQAALLERLQGVRSLDPFRRTYVTSRGEYVVVEVRDQLIKNADGAVVGMRCTVIDVTQHAMAEEALADCQRWLEAILRFIDDAVIAVDGLGAVAHLNTAAEQLTGWPAEEARGKPFESVLQVSHLNVGQWRDASLTGLFHRSLMESWHGRALVLHRDETSADATISSVPLSQNDHTVAGFVLMISRIPDSKSGPAPGTRGVTAGANVTRTISPFGM